MVPISCMASYTKKSIKKAEEEEINWVIACQYWRHPLRPKVSTTSGRGCFESSQTDRQTDGHGDSLTEFTSAIYIHKFSKRLSFLKVCVQSAKNVKQICNKKFHNIYVMREKLEGVGLVDKRPSTNKLHHFVQRKKRKNMTFDT